MKIVLFAFVWMSFVLCIGKPGDPELKKSDWPIQNQFAKVFSYKDAKINYIQMGSGPPLLLLHGGGSWSYSFRNILQPLSSSFTIYTIDLPGHGYSEVPSGFTFSLDSVNELLTAFAKYHNIQKMNLLGNSWGGGWAIYFAQKNPEKIKNLILLDASGLSNSNEWDQSSWKYLAYPFGSLMLYFITKDDIRKSYENELFYDKSLVTEDTIEEIYRPFIYSPNLLAQAEYQKNLNWEETGKNLSKLSNVIIVWGKQDKYLPVAMAYRYKEILPNAKLFIFEKSSHLPHEEEPEKLIEILRKELIPFEN